MSSKNIIQEYCQKRGWAIPIYNTETLDQSRFPSFQSTIIIPELEIEVTSDIFPNKKEAQTNAATKAYQLINSNQSKNNINKKLNSNIKFFVDVENKPNFVEEFIKIYGEKFTHHLICFISFDHPLKYRLNKVKDLQVITTPSQNKDGADVAIVYELGRRFKKNIQYYIVSSDHFAISLADYCGISVKVIKSVEEI